MTAEEQTGMLPVGTEFVVRGGQVYDGTDDTFAELDVAIGDGKVLRMAPDLSGAAGIAEIDATGLIVTPGLVDDHVHAFAYGQLIGLEVDPLMSRTGVTTFVDGGTTGSLHFLSFRKYVVEQVQANVYALLNVSAAGQMLDGIRGLDLLDYDDPRCLHLASAVEVVEANRDVIVGIKVRMYTGLSYLAPLSAARALADEVGLPMVVHLGSPPPSFEDVLPYLRAGDVITHVFHPGPGSLLDRDDRVRPEFREARARGVLIDTGTARYHTSFPIVRAALEQGFVPDTISTDLTANNVNQITIDLPTTMSKYMALGLSLSDVLARTTAAPAQLLPPARGLGLLVEGGPADLAVFALEEGEFEYQDFFGHSLRADRRLVNRVTIKDGASVPPVEQPLPTMAYSFVKR
ncbi:MAG: amidohydrolase family protein [Chloroflexota bacterium]